MSYKDSLTSQKLRQSRERNIRVFKSHQKNESSKMVTLNGLDLFRNNPKTDYEGEILQALKDLDLYDELLSIEKGGARYRLTFEHEGAARKLIKEGLTLEGGKNIRVEPFGQATFAVTVCGIPGFYKEESLREVFENFGVVEQIREVVKWTKTGISYHNGNRVFHFSSLKEPLPNKIYLDSHKLTLVFSEIPNYILQAVGKQDSSPVLQLAHRGGEGSSASGKGTAAAAAAKTTIEPLETLVEEIILGSEEEIPMSQSIVSAPIKDNNNDDSSSTGRRKKKKPYISPYAATSSTPPRLRSKESQAKEERRPEEGREVSKSKTNEAKGRREEDEETLPAPKGPPAGRNDVFESRETLTHYVDEIGAVTRSPQALVQVDDTGSVGMLGPLSLLANSPHQITWLDFTAGSIHINGKTKMENLQNVPPVLIDPLTRTRCVHNQQKAVYDLIKTMTGRNIRKKGELIHKDIYKLALSLRDRLFLNQ